MNELARKIADLSYDIVGFFLPGAIVMSLAIATALSVLEPIANPEQVRAVHLLVESPTASWVSIVAFVALSYLAAVWLQNTAANGTWKAPHREPPKPANPATGSRFQRFIHRFAIVRHCECYCFASSTSGPRATVRGWRE